MKQDPQRLIIATTARTGSELLCRLMRKTGVLGDPREYLNTRYMKSHYGDDSSHGDLFRKWWGGCYREGRIDSLKVMWSDFQAGLEGAATDADAVARGATWIHLLRRDRYAQAVSLLKGKITDQWHRSEKTVSPKDIDYFDFYSFSYLIHEIETHDACWRAFFMEHGLRPLEVAYEDLLKMPGEQMHAILEVFGSENGQATLVPVAESGLQKTATGQNAELIALGRMCIDGGLLEEANQAPEHPLVCRFPLWIEVERVVCAENGRASVEFSVTNHGENPVILRRQLFGRTQGVEVGLEWARYAVVHEKWVGGNCRLPEELGAGQRFEGRVETVRPLGRDRHRAFLMFMLDLGSYRIRMLGGNAPCLDELEVEN